MKKFSVGEPISGWPVETWNSLVDAKQSFDRFVQFFRDTIAQHMGLQHASVVKIVNKSGADVAEFTIMGIDDCAMDPPDPAVSDVADEVILGGVQLECIALDEDAHADNFVLTLEPIADDGVGSAVIAGATWARVDLQTADDTHGMLEDTDPTKFVGTTGDGAPILWKPSGTGEEWCVVLLGMRRGVQFKFGKLDADLDYDDTTGVTVSVWTGKPLADSGDNIANVLPPPTMPEGTIDSGTLIEIHYLNGHWYVVDNNYKWIRCTALLKGALDSEDASTTVDNVVPIVGLDPVNGNSATEITAYNVHDWDGDDNAPCRIEYNHSTSHWELYQVTCPA